MSSTELILETLKGVKTFAANVATVVLVLLIGWLIAKMIKNLVMRLADVFQVDSYTERVGVDKFLAKGGVKYSISELIAVLCYWLVMLIALVISLSLINLNVEILNPIVLYIPKVISAIVILVLGIFIASFVNSAVQTAAANVGIEQSPLLGKISQVVIIVFAIAIAFEQLEIGTDIITLVIKTILLSLGLAIALAFGLGCKDIAAKATQNFLDKLKSKD